jgi:methylenetetrahydrofolate reductase (NADPH)
MKLTEIWRSKGKPTVSFELFPARTPKAAASQEQAIGELCALEPDFVSVTFGAGGSTRAGSRELVEKLRARGLETLAYLACYGLAPEVLSEIVDGYRALGVENLLAVRGDEPEGEAAFVPHPASLPHASDLVALLRSRASLCLGVAGYPEGHRAAESRERDLEFLKLKLDRGAEFVITQYFYDSRFFSDFAARCSALGIRVPIVAGVMPIFSIKMMESLSAMCGATITDELRRGLAALPADDPEALVRFGIDFATEQCRGLLRSGVAGLHFYTLNRSRSACEIVRRLRSSGLL